ncbi:hypothetical protein [Bulleidia sp. zg-1006]|uniref:hypothetical protein n=2 Tax=Bulleidia sp. zg-1006 TaxID=2806552 RepID=UPI00193ABE38|nr:hypothetical protein [Bulleidia sp. zg-1006]QRG86380.1 hypothetical protein JOS54_05870 [Bulleidia sp. zg-1006]
MKVKLEQSEKQLLYDIGISIENREYEDDELLQIADEVYLEESCNVEKNEKLANLYAKLGDKLQGMISGV